MVAILSHPKCFDIGTNDDLDKFAIQWQTFVLSLVICVREEMSLLWCYDKFFVVSPYCDVLENFCCEWTLFWWVVCCEADQLAEQTVLWPVELETVYGMKYMKNVVLIKFQLKGNLDLWLLLVWRTAKYALTGITRDDGCWWPGANRHRAISSHNNDLTVTTMFHGSYYATCMSHYVAI